MEPDLDTAGRLWQNARLMPGDATETAVEQPRAALQMRASVMREPGLPVAVEEVALDPARRGEVLVRVAAAGVCHSDVHLADGALGDGRWPIVLGHEGAGVVEAVGEDVAGHVVGDHVVFCLVPACGQCRACRAGRRTLCEVAGARSFAGTLLDGSSRLRTVDGTVLQHGLGIACFAEYAVVPAGGVIKIPDEIPLWQAALLGCGVVTGFGAVSHAAGVRIGERVCVIGCGGVGLQVIAAARLAGASQIIAVDRGDDKLEHAIRRGATHAVDASLADPPLRSARSAAAASTTRSRSSVRRRRSGPPGTRSEPAAARSSSGSRRAASRCRCRRSSSCPRRRSSAATTARRTPRRRCPA